MSAGDPVHEGAGAPGDAAPLDVVRDVLGIDLPDERHAENLAAFARILEEIAKLRALDLTDVHPCVVFDPTAPYRREAGA